MVEKNHPLFLLSQIDFCLDEKWYESWPIKIRNRGIGQRMTACKK